MCEYNSNDNKNESQLKYNPEPQIRSLHCTHIEVITQLALICSCIHLLAKLNQ